MLEVLRIQLPVTAKVTSVKEDVASVTDDVLVQAVVSGDDAAYELIFERYRRPMTRLVARFFRERSDIEECVQQAFTKAFFSLKNYRGDGTSFKSWLSRIAVNICYDEFRRRQRKGENLFTEMSTEESEYVESLVDRRQTGTDNSLIAAQLVDKVMADLAPEDRIAMQLVYSEEYSLDEAASVIGITSSSLKSRLFRCRGQIKRRFGHIFR